MIDLDWIQRLIRIVDESDVDTLEVTRFATKVRVSKSPPRPAGDGAAGGATAAAPQATPAAPAAGSGGAAGGAGSAPTTGREGAAEATAPAAEGGEADEAASDLHEVTSPMVGTFYRAPAPDAPAYVEVGDRVEEGQTLCILEAMKLMNELDSDVSGVVEEVVAENGEPVEYGEVLFRLDTDAA